MTANFNNCYCANTYSYIHDHTAEACLEKLSGQGFRAFELMMYPGHCWPADLDGQKRREFGQFCRERGLRFTSLNMPNVDLNITGAAPEMRAYTRAILRGVFELAEDLEVPGVVIGPGKPNPLYPAPKEQLMGWFFEALDELVPIAEKAGVEVLVENMPFAFLPEATEMMAALEKYGNEEIRVVYDVANAVFIGEDLEKGFETVKSRLRLVHLSDTGREVYRHDPVGQGIVPFQELAGYLPRFGVEEAPVLEIISRTADTDLSESVQKLHKLGWDFLKPA